MSTFPSSQIPPDIEEALIDQIARTPPGEAPAPTVSAAGCLGAVLIGLLILLASHFLLQETGLPSLWRVPLELLTTLVAGYLVVKLWTRSHRSWGALTASGLPPSREELLQAYAEQLAPGWQELGRAEYLGGHPRLSQQGAVRVGKTPSSLTLIRFREGKRAEMGALPWEWITQITPQQSEVSISFQPDSGEAGTLRLFVGEGGAAPLAEKLKDGQGARGKRQGEKNGEEPKIDGGEEPS